MSCYLRGEILYGTDSKRISGSAELAMHSCRSLTDTADKAWPSNNYHDEQQSQSAFEYVPY